MIEVHQLPELGRRRHPRYGQSGSVQLRRMVTGPVFSGTLFEIAAGGCLVWMDDEMEADPADVVELRLSCGTEHFRVLGTIRYTEENGRLLGVAFERLNTGDRLSLEILTRRLQAAESAERTGESM